MGIAEGYDPAELVACVNNVTNAIPSDVTSPVNLYLGATAGMRVLTYVYYWLRFSPITLFEILDSIN